MQTGHTKRGIIALENGWLALIDKPAGRTSFDVVDEIRAITGEKKVGHAGSLDPMATGLLLIAAGKATTDLEKSLKGEKTYRATVSLGRGSPTWDRDAPWMLEVRPPEFEHERISRVLEKIRTRRLQTPPMVAALKRHGQPLYKLARRGWWLERVTREVAISTLELLGYEPGEGKVSVEVSGGGGLYVRSVARDMGTLLGVPAMLTDLRRTAVGPYRVEDAITLDEFAGEWEKTKR